MYRLQVSYNAGLPNNVDCYDQEGLKEKPFFSVLQNKQFFKILMNIKDSSDLFNQGGSLISMPLTLSLFGSPGGAEGKSVEEL